MRALLWFKQDLRLDDHPALQAGLTAECLLPVYVLDPALLQLNEFGMRRMGVHRARFLLESLVALEGELRQRGSHLLLVIGSAEQAVPQLVAQFNLNQVLTLEEIAPDERAQVARVARRLADIPCSRRRPTTCCAQMSCLSVSNNCRMCSAASAAWWRNACRYSSHAMRRTVYRVCRMVRWR